MKKPIVNTFLPNLTMLGSMEISATKKKKVDGELAATRLGQPVSVAWANERFRQCMLLVRQFRIEWENQSLLTGDDTEFIRSAIDVALSSAAFGRHVGDIYDLNATVWTIWMVQHVRAVRLGGFKVESPAVRESLSFANLYQWLSMQHQRGERFNVKDASIEGGYHRYKLPFKQFNFPPSHLDLFKWRKGAKRLSDWMVAGGFPPIDPAIQRLEPPELVAPPPLLAQREARRNAMWNSVANRARVRNLTSIQLNSAEEDATRTRNVIHSVMEQSREQRHSDVREMSDSEAEELERQLEAELEDAQALVHPQAPSSSSSSDQLSPYEIARLQNIARNRLVLSALGLIDNETPTTKPNPRPRDPFPPGRSGETPTRKSSRKRTPKSYANADSDDPSEEEEED